MKKWILLSLCLLIANVAAGQELAEEKYIQFVEVMEDRAYLLEQVVDQGYYLSVLDISTPTYPREIGRTYITEDQPQYSGITVSGDYALIPTEEVDYLVDISDPRHLVVRSAELGHSTFVLMENRVYSEHVYRREPLCYPLPPPGGCYMLAFSNVGVYDISDPDNPELVFEFMPPGVGDDNIDEFRLITSVGNYLYLGVTKEEQGHPNVLQVMDVSGPATPTVTTELDIMTHGAPPLSRLVVEGDLAYLVALQFMVLDLSDPSTPEVIAQHTFSEPIASLDVEESRLYYTTTGSFSGPYKYIDTLKVVDISDPTSPVELGSYQIVGPHPPPKQFASIEPVGNYIYAIVRGYLSILDISNPAAIVETSRYPRGEWEVRLPLIGR